MSLLSSITPTSVLPEGAPGTKKLLVNNTTKNNTNSRQHDESGPGKGKKKLTIKPALVQELADLMLFNDSNVDAANDANGVDDVWNIEAAPNSLDSPMTDELVESGPGQGKKRLTIKPALAQELADLELFNSSIDDANDVWNIGDGPELPPPPKMVDATDSLDVPMTEEAEQVVAAANIGPALSLPNDEFQEVVDWEFSLSADEILNQSLSWLCLDQDLPILSGDDIEDVFGPEFEGPGTFCFVSCIISQQTGTIEPS